MKDYIEERAISIASYIIDCNAVSYAILAGYDNDIKWSCLMDCGHCHWSGFD